VFAEAIGIHASGPFSALELEAFGLGAGFAFLRGPGVAVSLAPSPFWL